MNTNWFFGILIVVLFSCSKAPEKIDGPVQVSGIYPSLAYYNQEGECGTGAVVPWAGRLWVITYGPHLPLGSSDKLYEITPNLEQITREESIGGTPANRMIHKESNQLFIGPYAIDENRNVRVIPYDQMQGRHTGNARHLTDPGNKIYYGTMEEGFYEVDVNTLAVNMLYRDGNNSRGSRTEHNDTDVNPQSATLPGAHGKGLYSGQGVMIYSNNGEATQEALRKFDVEAGALAEWDGREWKLVRRNQFVEVTGPGGIYGNDNPDTDPLWATGWDHKSVILGVRDAQRGWDFYRLPKASHSYDGAHGWNTEWPRIRNVGTEDNPDYLMTMHGMFWRFPGTFSYANSVGIRPRSAYLKVIGDFARWNDQLVFGCDDSAQREFLNKRKHKGNIEGPGQSNSNLWFTAPDKPDQLGPNHGTGAVWLNEEVSAGVPSESFLFAGWENRTVWLANLGDNPVTLDLETDVKGDGTFNTIQSVELEAGNSKFIEFGKQEPGEWIRIIPSGKSRLSAIFAYSGKDERGTSPDAIFKGIADVNDRKASGGLLYGLGKDRRVLGVSAVTFDNGNVSDAGYYELDENLVLQPKNDLEMQQFIKDKFAIPGNVVEIQEGSVLITDDGNRRWRLPLGNEGFQPLTSAAQLRICREVATERDLFNCSGTFYELPAENADGFAKIRPVASHNFRIHDYASYRGMLVITGIQPDAGENSHLIRSADGKAAVWVGVIDDLWKMGKPVGKGGPWKNSTVAAGVPSDPYLIGYYDERTLQISHESEQPVTFTIEVEPLGHGPWISYDEVTIKPGETYQHTFSPNFHARWIRFTADKGCKATTWLEYR